MDSSLLVKYFLILSTLVMLGCTSLHIPNQGFEDPVVAGNRTIRFLGGFGSTQSLNFNEFEVNPTQDPSSIKTDEKGILNLGSSYGLTDDLDVGIASFSIFPSMIFAKYQLSRSDRFYMATALYYGYSSFSNAAGYSPIGGTCGENGELCSDDPNGRHVSGSLNTVILSLPMGYRLSDRIMLSVNPQFSYFTGRYVLTVGTGINTQDTNFGLTGYRTSLALQSSFSISESWKINAGIQGSQYDWTNLKSNFRGSFFLSVQVN